MPDLAQLWLPCLAALLVGLSKGGLPTIGMLAVPVLSLQISPLQAASLLLPIFIMTDAVSVYLYRKQFSAFNLKIFIPWGLVGVLVGWGTAAYLSERFVGLLVGLIGLVFVLNAWVRKSHLDTRPRVGPKSHGAVWGVLTGFTSFVSHAGGPPYQIYVLPQLLDKMVYVGTTTILFAVINLAKVVPYQMLRPYSTDDLMTALWLVPAGLLGTLAGAWLTKRIHGVWFFRLVQLGLFLVSVKLIADYFLKG
jgi:uncharacterized protein